MIKLAGAMMTLGVLVVVYKHTRPPKGPFKKIENPRWLAHGGGVRRAR
jgi:hypothetical protein